MANRARFIHDAYEVSFTETSSPAYSIAALPFLMLVAAPRRPRSIISSKRSTSINQVERWGSAERQRTMAVNALRGHLAEFGIVAAQGAKGLAELVGQVSEDSATDYNAIPPLPGARWARWWRNSKNCRHRSRPLRRAYCLAPGKRDQHSPCLATAGRSGKQPPSKI